MNVRRGWAFVTIASLASALPVAIRADVPDELEALSLEELSNLQVTSVSKSAELLRLAPASIYVITHDDIARAGVTTIAEALRLAPNLHLSQHTASGFSAGARGFAGAPDAQNFSNKLLILIDGRSVYSPLYSGVYLDAQDVLLGDIDRIEVISGAGATLWGANAMHGVINVITRPAYLSEGVVAHVAVGNQQKEADARLGERLSESVSWRAYAKVFERDSNVRDGGIDAEDEWHRLQGGFRLDWGGTDETFTAQGDAYRGRVNELGPDGPSVTGVNLLGRWQQRTAAADWQVQAYYDYSARAQPANGVAFHLDTGDVEAQSRWSRGDHRFVAGAGLRVHRFEIRNSTTLAFEPHDRTLTQANLFLQDTWAFAPRFDLTVGLKAERDGYGGWHGLPDVRLAWKPREDAMGWIAASRAIRSPTPFDRDVIERVEGMTFVAGNPDFRAERVDTLEVGFRTQPHPRVSLSVATFGNRYDDLRTIELTPVTLLPLTWGNLMRGETYGAEAWAKWQVTDAWRLSPGVRLLQKHLEFKAGASTLLGLAQAGNDPRWQAMLQSSMELTARLRLEMQLRYMDALPSPHLASTHELDANLSWRATSAVELALTGNNLLDRLHQEYPSPTGVWIRRSVAAQLRWRPEP